MGNGRCKMGDVGWKMGNGKCEMGDGNGKWNDKCLITIRE
jgi:hypothetical protein